MKHIYFKVGIIVSLAIIIVACASVAPYTEWRFDTETYYIEKKDLHGLGLRELRPGTFYWFGGPAFDALFEKEIQGKYTPESTQKDVSFDEARKAEVKVTGVTNSGDGIVNLKNNNPYMVVSAADPRTPYKGMYVLFVYRKLK